MNWLIYIYIYIYIICCRCFKLVNWLFHRFGFEGSSLHSAKGGAVETGCSDLYSVIHVLVYHVTLPQSIAPLIHCTPLCRVSRRRAAPCRPSGRGSERKSRSRAASSWIRAKYHTPAITNMNIHWKHATENPRWFLRCWFLVCNLLPLLE